MKKIRVYLRAFEIEDHVLLHKWRQDKDVLHNFSGVPLFSSKENERQWVESKIFDKQNVSCAICLRETDEFIGAVFLNDIDYHNRSGHIPTFIGEKSHWGKGYATDARILMLYYAFFERGLERIWARVLETNISALKMLEKSGYKQEGLLRRSKFRNGDYVNEIYLGVLKDDFIKVMSEYEL